MLPEGHRHSAGCHTSHPGAGVPDSSGNFSATAYLTRNHSGKMDHSGTS